MGKQKDILEKLAGTFQIRRVLLRQALAECLGSLILVVSTVSVCINLAGCSGDQLVRVKGRKGQITECLLCSE